MEVFCIAKNSNDLLCNEQIKVSQVLVIGPNGEQMGVKNINDAKAFLPSDVPIICELWVWVDRKGFTIYNIA